jgi:hypothetical protein
MIVLRTIPYWVLSQMVRGYHPPHVIADSESASIDDILAAIAGRLPVIPP